MNEYDYLVCEDCLICLIRPSRKGKRACPVCGKEMEEAEDVKEALFLLDVARLNAPGPTPREKENDDEN